ncbi:Linoleate 9S-lipoxygenase [Vigna angularis]|uniref:Linoleate 9S-lipoxygenase n=1 Tax=Phaseolus angularis TaxID=3914 RepID=A0A8T0KUE2_PHAAN|nr:Linoleate 9S-lipoxygenase [Vigna angularis]
MADSKSARVLLLNFFGLKPAIGGLYLPTDVISKISPIPVIKEIFRTVGEQVLKFPPPYVIRVSKSARMTDDEFGREMLAGVNPCLIQRLQDLNVLRHKDDSFLERCGTLKPLAIELSLPHPRRDEFGAVSRDKDNGISERYSNSVVQQFDMLLHNNFAVVG